MAEPFEARFDALLRTTLKAQAATLPVAIGPADVLRRRELLRRDRARGRIRLLLIAAVVALPLGAVLIGAPRPDPSPEGYSAVLVPHFNYGDLEIQVFTARGGVAERVMSLPRSRLDEAGIVNAAWGTVLEASSTGWIAMHASTDAIQASGHREFVVLLNVRDPDAIPVVREGTGLGAWTPDGLYWSATNNAYELIDPASGRAITLGRGVSGGLDWWSTSNGRMQVAAEGHGLILGNVSDWELPMGETNPPLWGALSRDGTLSPGLPEIAEGVGLRLVSSQWGVLRLRSNGVVSGPAPDGTFRQWGPAPPLHHSLADASWAVDGGVWLLVDRRSEGRTMLLVHRDQDNVDREVAAFPVEVDVQVSIGDLAPDDSLIGFNLVSSEPFGFKTVIVDTRSGTSHLFNGALGGFVANERTVNWATGDRRTEAGHVLSPPAPGGSSGQGYGPMLSVGEHTAFLLDADRILLVHEVAATSVDPGPVTNVTLGPIELEEGFGISLVCSGPGEITITEISLDGSREPTETFGCLNAHFPQGYAAPGVSREALVQVSVEFDSSTAWRLIVFDPPPSIPRR